MKIPKLFDLTNPTAPKWSTVDVSQDEVEALFESCVMFVGYDPRPDAQDRYVVLGSGFLISAQGTLTILTAAHIFTWWTDQIHPPVSHAFRGVTGDNEDMAQRMRYVIEQGHIRVAVAVCGFGDGMICNIEHISSNPRPSDGDIAIVQLSLPEGKSSKDYRVLRLDADPIDFREPVLMAGFIGGGRGIALDNEQLFGAAYWEQKLALRAGRVSEYASDADHQHRYMYRASIPSLPGMSGAPLIAMRSTHSPLRPGSEATAIGVVSSSGFAEPFLLDYCEEGETWVTPIVHSMGRKVRTEQGISTLSEAVKGGYIDAYGEIARRAVIERDPLTGVVSYKLEKKGRES